MGALTISLPAPVSVNHAWANRRGGGRVKTTRLKRWERDADACLMAQRRRLQGGRQGPIVPGAYRLDITISQRLRRLKGGGLRKIDLGNFEKVISDWLTSRGIIEDDHLAEQITLRWGDVHGCMVRIREVKR